MIASISGRVSAKTGESVVVEAGGLGYEIFVTSHDIEAAKLGEAVKYHTHDYVREDTHNLYGFTGIEAKQLFIQLIGISGIGPKVAMAILSSSTLDNLRKGIASGDPDFFKGVSGVGKKTAERIIVELRGKVEAIAGESIGGQDSAYQALIGLGYRPAEAAQAVAGVPKEVTEEQDRIKAALKLVKR